MNTLLITIIVGQLALLTVVLILVSSSSENPQLPGSLNFLVMSLLLIALLLVIWSSMSYSMAISREQKAKWTYMPLIGMVAKSQEKSQIWLLTEKHLTSCPNILVLPSPKSLLED